MYSYIALFGKNNTLSKDDHNSNIYLNYLRRYLTKSDLNLNLHEIELPDKIGKLLYIKPQINCNYSRELINQYSKDEYYIFVYGDVIDSVDEPARKIYLTYKKYGIDGVRRLDGHFTTLLINITTGEVISCTDTIGNRKPRYYKNENQLLVSSHDLMIMASGITEITINTTSIYSFLALDWSLEGKSFINDIHTLQPYEYLKWSPDQLEIVEKPLLTALHKTGVKFFGYEDVIKIIELFHKQIDAYNPHVGKINIDLTARLDSRAILGLALSHYERRKVQLIH